MFRGWRYVVAVTVVLACTGWTWGDENPEPIPTLVETLEAEFNIVEPDSVEEYLRFIEPYADEISYDDRGVLTLALEDEEGALRTVKVGELTVKSDELIIFNASVDGLPVTGTIERADDGRVVVTSDFTLLGVTLFEVPFCLPQITIAPALQSDQGEVDLSAPDATPVKTHPSAERQQECVCTGTGWCSSKMCDKGTSCEDGIGDCEWREITGCGVVGPEVVLAGILPLGWVKHRRRRRRSR